MTPVVVVEVGVAVDVVGGGVVVGASKTGMESDISSYSLSQIYR